MLKTKPGLLILALSVTCVLSAKAQTDTLKKDSVKIDTAVLNKYRINSRKNAIPTRVRPIQIQREMVPVTMLDYKVNYWKKVITFGLNFSQSAFSSNYAAGGVSAVALGSAY